MKMMTGKSLHRFTKGKSCLTNLIAFCNGIIGSGHKGSSLDVVYVDFSWTFETVSRGIVKLIGYELDDWTTIQWVED